MIPVPEPGSFGVAVQLYAAQSRRSAGIGDFADLQKLGALLRRSGARTLHLNPLGATAPGIPQESCPYFASTRRFANPLYVRLENLPEAYAAADVVERATTPLRSRQPQPIQRNRVYTHKLPALTSLFASGVIERPRFESFRHEMGASLENFARFQVLSETFGPDFRNWPEEFRHPDRPEVAEFAAQHHARIEFYAWLVHRADDQLGAAAREIDLVTDLPIGFAPHGFDAWEWQDLLIPGQELGCPPDDFNRDGQNWQLPAFDPTRLVDTDFVAFRQTLQSLLRHARGIRVDHILGLSRQFLIPVGAPPAAGNYVTFPRNRYLDVLCEVAREKNAFVIGEDLGTVEADLRAALAERNILSTRLLWFEEAASTDWPALSAASITTHDLPTIAGLYSGEDTLSPEHTATMATRFRAWGLNPDTAGVDAAIVCAYEQLARAPSRLVVASIEDFFASRLRPNFPGTTRPDNWCRSLPMWIDDLERQPMFETITELLVSRQ